MFKKKFKRIPQKSVKRKIPTRKKLKRKNILDSQLLNREGEGGEDEFGFLDNEDEDEEILEKPQKKKEIRPKNNISVQDFGLPPIESSDDELDNV